MGPLLKTGLALIGNVIKPLAKTVLMSLTAAAATDATIQRKSVLDLAQVHQ